MPVCDSRTVLEDCASLAPLFMWQPTSKKRSRGGQKNRPSKQFHAAAWAMSTNAAERRAMYEARREWLLEQKPPEHQDAMGNSIMTPATLKFLERAQSELEEAQAAIDEVESTGQVGASSSSQVPVVAEVSEKSGSEIMEEELRWPGMVESKTGGELAGRHDRPWTKVAEMPMALVEAEAKVAEVPTPEAPTEAEAAEAPTVEAEVAEVPMAAPAEAEVAEAPTAAPAEAEVAIVAPAEAPPGEDDRPRAKAAAVAATEEEAGRHDRPSLPCGTVLAPTVGETQLHEMYGIGAKIMQQMGYKLGSGLGAVGRASTTTTCLIQQPRVPGAGLGSAASHAADRRGDRTAVVSDVLPPKCSQCEKEQWPATEAKHSANWWCRSCWIQHGSPIPTCISCASSSWDGWRKPGWEGGDWMCAECWEKSDLHHADWAGYFKLRRETFPDVVWDVGHEEQPCCAMTYVWDTMGGAAGKPEAWATLREYPISSKNWRRLQWEGHLVSEPASIVDHRFVQDFLSSRPRVEKALLDHTTLEGQWFRFPVAAAARKAKHRQDWAVRYHASSWYTFYSCLINGLQESTKNIKRSAVGVYSFADKAATSYYNHYIMMPDGVAWTITYELLVDVTHQHTRFPGQRQTCSKKDSTMITAVHVRGFTQNELADMAVNAPGTITLLGQWQPEMEADPLSLSPSHF